MRSSVMSFVVSVLVGALPPAAQAEAPPFILSWGSQGTGDGQFMNPFAIAIGLGDVAYVCDRFDSQAPMIRKFTTAGVFLTKWGTEGLQQGGYCTYIRGLATGPSGNVYAADECANQVEVTTSLGAYVRTFGASGSGPGQLNTPVGVVVDNQEDVYVVDSSNHRVQRFTSTGAYVLEWGTVGTADGQFMTPYAIAIDGNGNVYVSDFASASSRVQKFSSTGTFLLRFGSPGTGGDGLLANPSGVAVDAAGRLYVAEAGSDQIHVFDAAGSFVMRWGQTGTGPGQFDRPTGIGVDQSGSIYVVDSNNERVQKFGPLATPVDPSSWGRLKAQYRH